MRISAPPRPDRPDGDRRQRQADRPEQHAIAAAVLGEFAPCCLAIMPGLAAHLACRFDDARPSGFGRFRDPGGDVPGLVRDTPRQIAQLLCSLAHAGRRRPFLDRIAIAGDAAWHIARRMIAAIRIVELVEMPRRPPRGIHQQARRPGAHQQRRDGWPLIKSPTQPGSDQYERQRIGGGTFAQCIRQLVGASPCCLAGAADQLISRRADLPTTSSLTVSA